MEVPGNEFMPPTSHGPRVSSTLRGLMATAHQSSCLGLHAILTAKRLAVFAAGACGRKFLDTGSHAATYPRFRRDADNGNVSGAACAIATSTATIRARRPSTISNVSGTAREKSRRTILDFFQKTKSDLDQRTRKAKDHRPVRDSLSLFR
jgi:hypothetical protein